MKNKRKFTAMATAYFAGTFNDNYYKQAAMLLAVTAGLSSLQGTATVLFSLPFVLFSAYGGWMADHYPKKKVIIGIKIVELIACLIGAVGLLFQNWNCVLAMVFIMGLQATVFGPALNATIPELFDEGEVTKANALLKLITTLAILIGVAAAGFSLDQHWFETEISFGLILVSAVVVAMAIFGLASSFFIYDSPKKNHRNPFPHHGPLQSLKDVWQLRQRKDLMVAVFSSTFFYSFSTLLVLIINTLGLRQFGYSQTLTSLLCVALMIGVCIGAFLAGKKSSPTQWMHLLPFSGATMFAGLILVGLSPFYADFLRLPLLALFFTFIGVAGGLLIIPATTFYQVKPEAHEKGKIVGVVNFCDFTGIILAGEFYILLDHFFSPSNSVIILSFFALVYTYFALKADKKFRV